MIKSGEFINSYQLPFNEVELGSAVAFDMPFIDLLSHFSKDAAKQLEDNTTTVRVYGLKTSKKKVSALDFRVITHDSEVSMLTVPSPVSAGQRIRVPKNMLVFTDVYISHTPPPCNAYGVKMPINAPEEVHKCGTSTEIKASKLILCKTKSLPKAACCLFKHKDHGFGVAFVLNAEKAILYPFSIAAPDDSTQKRTEPVKVKLDKANIIGYFEEVTFNK